MAGRAAVVALMLLAACGGPDEPRVEVRDGEAWRAVAVRGYEVDGERDGDRTRVAVDYALDDGVHLRLSMRVFFDPRPVLESGTWARIADGETGVHGVVRVEDLRFTGGQNEGPSLGGRFRLETEAGPRYRVVMPLRPVRSPRWPR